MISHVFIRGTGGDQSKQYHDMNKKILWSKKKIDGVSNGHLFCMTERRIPEVICQNRMSIIAQREKKIPFNIIITTYPFLECIWFLLRNDDGYDVCTMSDR